jgi:hypothetical protein
MPEDSSACQAANAAILRAAFGKLTDAFLAPLKRGFLDMWNAASFDAVLGSSLDRLFSKDMFYAYLKAHVEELKPLNAPSKVSLDLYESFLSSDSFRSFRELLWRYMLYATLESVPVARLASLFRSKSDEQIVTVCLRIAELKEARQSWGDQTMATKLDVLKDAIMETLASR